MESGVGSADITDPTTCSLDIHSPGKITSHHHPPRPPPKKQQKVEPHVPIDQRVDVWAMGCLLFAAAYGRSPFESPTEGVLKLGILRWGLVDLRVLVTKNRGVYICVDKMRCAIRRILIETAPHRPQSAYADPTKQ